MTVRTRKAPRTPMWRLDLACGHVAYALESEPHRERGWRACAACGPHVKCRVVAAKKV